MSIQQSLAKLQHVQERIFDEGGELTPLLEKDYDTALEVAKGATDYLCRVYKTKTEELEREKKNHTAWVKSREASIERFRTFLERCVDTFGKLKGSKGSIDKLKRQSVKVMIEDFDLVALKHPEVVTMKIDDNVKTVKLSKPLLKIIWMEEQESPTAVAYGFHCVEETKETLYIRNTFKYIE